MRKSEATTMDNMAEKGYVGSFHHVSQFLFQKLRRYQKTKPQWIINGKILTWDVKKERSKSEVISQAKKD